MPYELIQSLQNQEFFIKKLENDREQLPLKQLEGQMLIDQVDRENLAIFCYDEEEERASKKKGSICTDSTLETANENCSGDKDFVQISYIDSWLDCIE